MPLSRTVLERQLSQAESAVAAWVGQLSQSGAAREEFRNDPKWRTLNAQCAQLRRRLESVAQTEATDAEVARRKVEREAAAEAERQEPKPSKKTKAPEAKAGKQKEAKAAAGGKEQKKDAKPEAQKAKSGKK
jgi:hypothetical protein